MKTLLKTGAGLMFAAYLATPAFSMGDNPMDKTLEVRVLQSGFAGITGTIYRIEPNGEFVARNVINEVEGEIIKSGQLNLEEMNAIAETLRDTDVEALPPATEIPVPVNPAMIELRYGDKTHLATLPAGDPELSGCEGNPASDLCRVQKLSSTVANSVENHADR
jgi:hypothetical protein